MPVVWIPAQMRDHTGGQAQVTVTGATVREVIDQLGARYPGLRGALLRGDQLNPYLAVRVDGVRSGLGLQEPVDEGSEVTFMPLVGGG